VPGESLRYFFTDIKPMDKLKEQQLKEITTEFLKVIVNHFNEWSRTHNKESNLDTFINFLVGSSLIPRKQIINFMIVYLYPLVLQKKKGKKMQTIYEMEDFFPLQETQIRTILKHYGNKFYYNKNLLDNEEKL
jgi:hypothetical protein